MGLINNSIQGNASIPGVIGIVLRLSFIKYVCTYIYSRLYFAPKIMKLT